MTRITRDTFISEDHIKVALTHETMYTLAYGGRAVEIPIPEAAKRTGILPTGTRVDFVLDPDTVVVGLAKQNVTTLEQLPEGLLEDLKGVINGPDNLRIVPTSIYEEKRELVQKTFGLDSAEE